MKRHATETMIERLMKLKDLRLIDKSTPGFTKLLMPLSAQVGWILCDAYDAGVFDKQPDLKARLAPVKRDECGAALAAFDYLSEHGKQADTPAKLATALEGLLAVAYTKVEVAKLAVERGIYGNLSSAKVQVSKAVQRGELLETETGCVTRKSALRYLDR